MNLPQALRVSPSAQPADVNSEAPQGQPTAPGTASAAERMDGGGLALLWAQYDAIGGSITARQIDATDDRGISIAIPGGLRFDYQRLGEDGALSDPFVQASDVQCSALAENDVLVRRALDSRQLVVDEGWEHAGREHDAAGAQPGGPIGSRS